MRRVANPIGKMILTMSFAKFKSSERSIIKLVNQQHQIL
jgi:hypothetical protein